MWSPTQKSAEFHTLAVRTIKVEEKRLVLQDGFRFDDRKLHYYIYYLGLPKTREEEAFEAICVIQDKIAVYIYFTYLPLPHIPPVKVHYPS